MWVFMLGFLGFPLTGGFIGKFYVFAAAYDHGCWWLIVAGVIATMISAYYYLGIVRAMYFRDAAELQLAPAGGAPPLELLLERRRRARVAVTVGSFFAVEPLIDVARSAARLAAALGLRASRGAERHPGSTGAAATNAFSRRRRGRRRAPRRRAAARRPPRSPASATAHESTSRQSASPHRSACRPPTDRRGARGMRRTRRAPATAVNGTAREQRVEGEAVRAAAVGERRCDRQEGREHRDVPRTPSFSLGADGPSMLTAISTEGALWRHSPGSAMPRSASTRTTASASTSTLGSAARRARTPRRSPSAPT